MSEGTSLDDIESGTVQYEADQAAMNAIMADMNALEPEHVVPPMQSMPPPMPPIQPMPPMQPMPQMQPMHQISRDDRFTAQYEPVRSKESIEGLEISPKKNGWS